MIKTPTSRGEIVEDVRELEGAVADADGRSDVGVVVGMGVRRVDHRLRRLLCRVAFHQLWPRLPRQ